MSDKSITLLGSRGQLSIPAHIRAKANLRVGQRFRWVDLGNGIFQVQTLGRKQSGAGFFSLIGAAHGEGGSENDLIRGRNTKAIMKLMRDGEK